MKYIKDINEMADSTQDLSFLLEGVMSDLHLLAKEVKTEEEFIKKFFKEHGDKVKKTPDSVEWVKSLYKDTIGESIDEAYGTGKVKKFKTKKEVKDFLSKFASKGVFVKEKGNKIHFVDGVGGKKMGMWDESTGILSYDKKFTESVDEGKKEDKMIKDAEAKVAKVVDDLKSNLEKFKAAKTPQEKEKYKKEAARLTKLKKEAQKEVDDVITNLHKDAKLEINEMKHVKVFEQFTDESTLSEAYIGPFVFNDKMSDEELKDMYDAALDGYSYYQKGMHHAKSDYKKAYQEIEKILKKRGVAVDESTVTEGGKANAMKYFKAKEKKKSQRDARKYDKKRREDEETPEDIELRAAAKMQKEELTERYDWLITEGQFSWFTQDTRQQIGNQPLNRIDVWMFDNEGNKWMEKRYEGYGEFGGMDYYVLLAKMNGYNDENIDDTIKKYKIRVFGNKPIDKYRQVGIDLAFDEIPTLAKGGKVLFPALVSTPRFNWKQHDFTQEAKNDPNQGWYMDDDDDDDDDEYGW